MAFYSESVILSMLFMALRTGGYKEEKIPFPVSETGESE